MTKPYLRITEADEAANKETLVKDLARHFSEWTDDEAPIREKTVYTQAAEDFVNRHPALAMVYIHGN